MTAAQPTTPDAAATAAGGRARMIRHSAYNMAGVVLPAIVAVACTPLLLRLLGPETFGLFSIQLAILILLSVNDLGISRAILLVAINAGGFGNAATRDRTVGAGLDIIVCLSVLVSLIGIVALAVATAVGVAEHAAAWLLLIGAAALALPTLPLRSRLETQERFGLLSLLRGISSSLLFACPLAAVLIEPTIEATALAHFVSRALVLGAYSVATATVFRGRLKGSLDVGRNIFHLHRLPLHAELLRRGGWLGLAGLTSTAIAYVDRLILGLIAGAVAVTSYTVAAELATKVWLMAGAFIVAGTPRIAAGIGRNDAAARRQLSFLAGIIFILAIGAHAAFLLAGEWFLRLWLGDMFAADMATILMVLSLGVSINCLSQVNYMLIQIAGGERRLAKLQLAMLALVVVLGWLVGRTHGAIGIAWLFAGRLMIDAVVHRIMLTGMQQQAGGTSLPLLGAAIGVLTILTLLAG